MVKINGRQYKLANGNANKAGAEQTFHELMVQRCIASEAINARVTDFIEAFLDWSKIHLYPDTYRGHMYHGQKFAEACEYVRVVKLKPLRVTLSCDTKRPAGEWNEVTEYNAKYTAFRIFSWAAEK